MSRRCDREGVAWDDRLRGYDRELLRAEPVWFNARAMMGVASW